MSKSCKFLIFEKNFYSAQLKSRSSIPDKAWSFYHKKKTPKSLRITYAILYYSMYEKSPTEEYLQ